MYDYSDAPDIIVKFLNYKRSVQNRSEKTVYQYYHDLKSFTRFLLLSKNESKYKDIPFSEIDISEADDQLLIKATPDDLFEYLSFAVNTLNNQVLSRKRKTSCLNSFYKYLHKTRKLINFNPAETIENPSTPKKLPKFLTLDESKLLLESIEGNNRVRDFCIITLFLNCGMRVSELCGINLSDISPDISSVNVTGKGSKERMIYLNAACKNAIEEYLKVRPKDAKHSDKDALFISRNKNRLSVQTVQWLIYKHLNTAGLSNRHLSVHKLRHTAATLMYQYGKTDVRVLKDILGHEQLSTTQIYTHINNESIREAVDNNPLSNVKQSSIKVNDNKTPDEE